MKYRILVMKLEKPFGSDDNEAVDVDDLQSLTASETILEVIDRLPELGGDHSAWLEVHEAD